jgi:hypothetical protein
MFIGCAGGTVLYEEGIFGQSCWHVWGRVFNYGDYPNLGKTRVRPSLNMLILALCFNFNTKHQTTIFISKQTLGNMDRDDGLL